MCYTHLFNIYSLIRRGDEKEMGGSGGREQQEEKGNDAGRARDLWPAEFVQIKPIKGAKNVLKNHTIFGTKNIC